MLVNFVHNNYDLDNAHDCYIAGSVHGSSQLIIYSISTIYNLEGFEGVSFIHGTKWQFPNHKSCIDDGKSLIKQAETSYNYTEYRY